VPGKFGDVALTRIGRMRKGKGVRLEGTELAAMGYDHLRT